MQAATALLDRSCAVGRMLSAGPALAIICCCPVVRAEEASLSPVERLTQQAVEAGLAGELDRRQRLLDEALELDPDHAPARWEAGYLRVGDDWQSVAEAQVTAASDQKLHRYAELRQATPATPQGHFELARWCRRKGLSDEARFHWLRVLSAHPQHKQALSALQSTWHDGQLVTVETARQLRQQEKQQNRANMRWREQIARWRRALDQDAAATEAAFAELRTSVDATAIPEFERLASGKRSETATQQAKTNRLCLEFVETLGEMSVYPATESLVRHAVLAPAEPVHSAAVDHLNDRPIHESVPLLLSVLAPPIESDFSVSVDALGGVVYLHEFRAAGPSADYVVEYEKIAQVTMPLTQNLRFNRRSMARRNLLATARAPEFFHQLSAEGAAIEKQLARENARRETRNGRAAATLAQVTGKDFGDDLQGWWSYWTDYNEYDRPNYANDDRPIYKQTMTKCYCEQIPLFVGSCFVAGTPVRTKTGSAAIETLGAGDLVLTKDIQTGELGYRPVLATTTREPCPTLKITISGSDLQTTLGHPFWVPGRGWRMAKELSPGVRLLTLEGPVDIQQVSPSGEQVAYNLVVDGSGNYFVGPPGLLVHDNTPRRADSVRLGVD